MPNRAKALHRTTPRRRGRLLAGLILTVATVAVSVVAGSTHEAAQAASIATFPTGKVTSNGRVWTPVVSQNFTTTAAAGQFAAKYGTAWAGYSGFADTSNKGLYDPKDVLSVHGGVLDFNIRTISGRPRVAAPMPNGYKPQTYGRYAVRFRTDAIAGYKMAFLLWPTSNEWNDGEIDWPDGVLGGKSYAASAVKGTFKNGAMTFDGPPHSAAPTMGTGWHTAVTEWTAGHVRWYMDGKLIGQTTKPSGVPTKPMRWTLQAETNTDSTPVSSSAHGHILVDWVVQYK